MAGKELYIEPILDANLSVIPGLSDNIAEMTAQLNETTRILTNVLANQGLEAHQQAYNGSAFSALTLHGLDQISALENPTTLSFPYTDGYIIKPYEFAATVNKGASDLERWFNCNCTLDENEEYFFPSTISWQLWADSGMSWKFKAVLVKEDGSQSDWIESNPSNSGTTPCIITVPDEYIGEKIKEFWGIITISGGSDSSLNVNYKSPYFADAEGNSKQYINKRLKRLQFNSVNALTFYAPPASGSITADIIDTIIPQTTAITLPDIVSVGTWAVFLANGNIEGVNLALVDNTSHDLIALLPAATSDISSVTQTSNLALSVSMTAETQVIRSIAQRYY